MDVKNYGGWIVRSEGEYLIAVAYSDTRLCRWSNSPFNAAFFTRMDDAVRVAQKVGGEVLRFNPITGVVG